MNTPTHLEAPIAGTATINPSPPKWLSVTTALLIAGLVGWFIVSTMASGTAETLTSYCLNLAYLAMLLIVTSTTRTVSLRLLFVMMLAGGTTFGVAILMEKVVLIPSLMPLKDYISPVIEETVKLSAVLTVLLLMRRFSRWTLGVTDLMLMGAAAGAGFSVVYDAAAHMQRPWNHGAFEWLFTTDVTSSGSLIVGHAIWTTIAAATVGFSLFFEKRRKRTALIATFGVLWCIIDRIAFAGAINHQKTIVDILGPITDHGTSSLYILAILLILGSWHDWFVQRKFLPAGQEYRKVGWKVKSLAGVWEYLLDQRRLANANYHRLRDPRVSNRSSLVAAILAQSLINQNHPEEECEFLESFDVSGPSGLRRKNMLRDGTVLTEDTLMLPEHYELVSLINIGGVGAVYKARHVRTDASLAIKILHKRIAEKGHTRDRFKMDAKTTSKLQHPNLMIIHDYGVTPSEVPFIVMEYVEGITLKEEISITGGLTPERFFRVFDQVCEALIHAHNKGIIHRDIKPSNIIINTATNDFVKIIDFGISKMCSADGREPQQIDQSGDIFGSPLYMSPEQCLGEPLDRRSDIYALGCVMYETICGKPPLIGENPIKTIYKHVHVDPERFALVRPDLKIPTSVEMIIFKALEKFPADRFEDITEMKVALSMARSVMQKR